MNRYTTIALAAFCTQVATVSAETVEEKVTALAENFQTWRFDEKVDAMTDEKAYSLQIGYFEDPDNPADTEISSMGFTCDSDVGFVAQFKFGTNLMKSRYGKLEYRIDGGKSKDISYEITRDRSVLYFTWGTAKKFAKKLIEGNEEVLLRAYTWSGEERIAKYSLVGLDDAIAPLREHCDF